MNDQYERNPLSRLTPRQIEVLSLVAQRFSSKEIARRLHLSHKTVDRHVEEINSRLGVPSRSEAGRVYLQEKQGHGEGLPMVSESLASAVRGTQTLPQPGGAVGADPGSLDEPINGKFDLLAIVKDIFALPPVGGVQHDLGLAQRLIVAGRIAFISIIFITVIIVILSGILTLLSK